MVVNIKFKKQKGKEKNIVKKEIEKTPKIAILTAVLLFTMLISFIRAVTIQNWVLAILILVIAALITLPRVIGKWSKVVIPPRLEVYIIAFLYATLFLGELKSYYAMYWWWDVVIHTSSGLAFGVVGFILLYILYKAEKIKTSPKTIAMFSFVFALAIGALWEIVEFGIDNLFNNSHMQASLSDTMWDLIVDSLGALFSAVVGYLYIKSETGMAGTAMVETAITPMVQNFKKDNPGLFKKKKLNS